MWQIQLTVRPPHELRSEIVCIPVAVIRIVGGRQTKYILPQGLSLIIVDPKSDVLVRWILTDVSVSVSGEWLSGYIESTEEHCQYKCLSFEATGFENNQEGEL